MSRTRQVSRSRLLLALAGLILVGFLIGAYGCNEPAPVAFAVKHIRDSTGQQNAETISYDKEPGLDNSKGAAPLQVQIALKREYKYRIIVNLTSNRVSEKSVKQKIVELYKLPPNNPEDTQQWALCPLSIVIPAGRKARVTVEWTERWVEGVINEGAAGAGDWLGTYKVYMGYLEPCSLVTQDNVQ